MGGVGVEGIGGAKGLVGVVSGKIGPMSGAAGIAGIELLLTVGLVGGVVAFLAKASWVGPNKTTNVKAPRLDAFKKVDAFKNDKWDTLEALIGLLKTCRVIFKIEGCKERRLSI